MHTFNDTMSNILFYKKDEKKMKKYEKTNNAQHINYKSQCHKFYKLQIINNDKHE